MRHMESMEGRRLLSATLTDGVLSVAGTEGNDRIMIRNAPDGQIAVIESTMQAPGSAPVAPTVTKFALADVTSILVDAKGGNDAVRLMAFKRAESTETGASRVGIPATILGGAGNDMVQGGIGAESIDGGPGLDRLHGGRGNDTIEGGEGNDMIVGGAGEDVLRGGAGNDRIDARDRAADVVDGGDNLEPTSTRPGDVALVDADDVVSNVERVITRPTTPPTGGERSGESVRDDVLGSPVRHA